MQEAGSMSPREDPAMRRALFAEIHQRASPTENARSFLGAKKKAGSNISLSLQEVCFNYLVSNIECVEVLSRFNAVSIPTHLKVGNRLSSITHGFNSMIYCMR